MQKQIFLAGAARTPIGNFGGGLASVPAVTLAAETIRASLAAGIPNPDQIIIGNVISAGLGQNPARQAAIAAGVPVAVPAMTVNKVCGSGLQAVIVASQMVRCGDAECIIAGGTESMSRAPYLLDKARSGYRLGDGELVDSLMRDGLWDIYHGVHVGQHGEACANACGFSREQQDDFAIASYERALAAAAAGHFAAELTPVAGAAGDEGPAKFNPEKLRKLRPAFAADGTITAGNASSINDGAATLAVVSEAACAEAGTTPLARLVACSSASREPEWFTLAPVSAIQRLLARTGWAVDDVDLFEINEAFSAVTMAAMKELSLPHEKVNVHGGAVALGHPLGASGARILVTLLHALATHDLRRGVAALCIGGGEAVAVAVERV